MSLLMEALRKAEEAKRKIQTQDPDPLTGFSRAPATRPDITPAPVLSASPEPDATQDAADSGINADYLVDNFPRAARNDSDPEKPSTVSTFRSKPGRASVEELQSYLETTPEPEEAPHIPLLRTYSEMVANPKVVCGYTFPGANMSDPYAFVEYIDRC